MRREDGDSKREDLLNSIDNGCYSGRCEREMMISQS